MSAFIKKYLSSKPAMLINLIFYDILYKLLTIKSAYIIYYFAVNLMEKNGGFEISPV